MPPEMKTTEIKYAIMDRVTGKLLDYYESFTSTYLTSAGSATWLTSSLAVAAHVFEGTEEGTYTNPILMVNISPSSHCVVKVTMVCTVEIIE